jgi:histone deacetylase complex regulatory component SIN3
MKRLYLLTCCLLISLLNGGQYCLAKGQPAYLAFEQRSFLPQIDLIATPGNEQQRAEKSAPQKSLPPSTLFAENGANQRNLYRYQQHVNVEFSYNRLSLLSQLKSVVLRFLPSSIRKPQSDNIPTSH